MAQNHLYYGDNIQVLRDYVVDDSVDLVYLDPPFKSDQDYNILFEERDGSRAAAQIQAFEDTWRWDLASATAYEEVVEAGGSVSRVMRAFRRALGENDMLAYLSMMAPRLKELRRVLRETGSIYLHCDPTASHYLKMLMDAVFGPKCFRNEIIWKRTSGHSDARRYGRVHDVILYFTRGENAKWNQIHQPYEQAYIDQYYRYADDDGRRFMSGDISAAGLQGGGYEYEWKGHTRVWRVSRERMRELDQAGRIYYTRNGIARMKRYLDEMPGLPAQDVWTDIEALRSWHLERLGYPTQKPAALLERLIEGSSDEGDLILDPFCGCGTTIAAAHKMGRRWIGIDITHLAVNLMKYRLLDTFGDEVASEFDVTGEPVTAEDAQALADESPFQFEAWACSLVGARKTDQKGGADRGIDGTIVFHDDESGDAKEVIISVKSGQNIGVGMVRDLRGVIEREDAAIGVLITMREATKPMRAEAASAGFYQSPWGKFPKIQLRTINELLDGHGIERPRTRDSTFRRAPRSRREPETGDLYASQRRSEEEDDDSTGRV